MASNLFTVPFPKNEPVKSYSPGSKEREEVLKKYKEMYSTTVEVPNYIGDKEVKTDKKKEIRPPHDHQKVVGYYYDVESAEVKKAIDSALKVKKDWENMAWEHRMAIFLKAAELLAGPYRAEINAATMIGQSKNIYQAEIDAACETIDFLRFNCHFVEKIYKQQPVSDSGIWNRLEYRPLEGFIYAITPFNFTAIGANLCAAPAMLGNVCLWKPSPSQMYSAKVVMKVFKEAGLPDGVINMVSGDAEMVTDIALSHPDFSGLHFTGSTFVFKSLWKKIGNNIEKFKTYPKIVGETGGKDFIWAHPNSNFEEVGTAIIRAGFEYQGQKCSAASRVYVPKSMWADLKSFLEKDMATIKMGSTEDMSNFVNAVINEAAFDKLSGVIDEVKADSDAEIVIGGGYDKSKGYFIEPTIVLAKDSQYKTMVTELFGPIVTIYLYEDDEWESSLDLIDKTSDYALTGGIFARNKHIVEFAANKLKHSAGNFYINDKPTGAVVGQQPFGGGRSSGTNDKAGSIFNLLRWVSPRTIKETFVPAKDYRYPFLDKD